MGNNGTVRVWDIWVRLCHWTLVAMFVVAYFTAEEENIFHIYSILVLKQSLPPNTLCSWLD